MSEEKAKSFQEGSPADGYQSEEEYWADWEFEEPEVAPPQEQQEEGVPGGGDLEGYEDPDGYEDPEEYEDPDPQEQLSLSEMFAEAAQMKIAAAHMNPLLGEGGILGHRSSHAASISQKNQYSYLDALQASLSTYAASQDKGDPILPLKPYALPSEMVYISPPLDLLSQGNEESREELLMAAYDLEQVLADFGVKAAVTQIQPSFRYTRFEIRPKEGMNAGKLLGLSEDIQYRLDVQGIRVEEGVGEDRLNVWIRNAVLLPVKLRGALASDQMVKFEGTLPLVLGKKESGKTVVVDLAEVGGLLISGRPGTGKTTLLQSVLMGVLYLQKPSRVRFVLMGEAFAPYEEEMHLLLPVAKKSREAYRGFLFLEQELHRREEAFYMVGAKDYEAYLGLGGEIFQAFPRIIVAVDEISQILPEDREAMGRILALLASQGKTYGIHLLLATREPALWTIPFETMVAMPNRIAFQTATALESKVLLGTEIALHLEMEGECLLGLSGQEPERLQGVYVTKEEIVAVSKVLSRG